MIRVQIQFTTEQSDELRRQARMCGVSVSALVREAVDRELQRRETREEAWARALAAIGSFSGDGSSVAENHDEYLAEAYAAD